MSMRFKFGLGLLGVRVILHSNYTQVPGKVLSSEVDCYVKSGRPR